MKIYLSTYIFLFLSFIGYSQGTVRGFVSDKLNGEPVPFSNAILLGTEMGGTTNLDGVFTIPKVPEGKYQLKISNVEYTEVTVEIIVKKKEITRVDIDLSKGKLIDVVNVSAEDKSKLTNPQVSVQKMDKITIERIPNIGGESDITGALSITPGVITTGDQGGQLYVRGGTPIQNKILLDGMTIYNPFHSIGFFSVFDTELIKNVDIYTGGFGAKYGGRISSIMDISYRDGNSKRFSGKLSVSPFMAKTYLETPLFKAKKKGGSHGALILSAKKSLIEYSSPAIYPYVNNGNGMPFSFLDIYGKLSFKANGGSKVSLFGFNFNDKVGYPGLDLGWNSFGGGLNFSIVPNSNPMLVKGKINFSKYALSMQEVNLKPRYSEIFGFEGGFDFTYFLPKSSEINYGITVGGFKTDYSTFNSANRLIQDKNFTTEIGVYFSYRAIIKKIFVLEPSFRMQFYASVPFFSAEPRLAMKINAHKMFRIKFAGGRFSQNFSSASSDQDVVNLFNGFLSAPTNLPSTFQHQDSSKEPVEIKNGIQTAWHAVGGFEIDIIKGLTVNIEAYFKWFDRLTNINTNKLFDEIPGSTSSNAPDHLKKDFIIESGKAYGMDISIKYVGLNKRLNIWAIYSLGKVTRWDGFKQYTPIFDRRHNVNLIASYTAGKRKDWDFSIRWNYGSGLPFTQTAGFYQSTQFNNGVNTDFTLENSKNISTQLGPLNQGRLPLYQRLDITAKKKFFFKKNMILEIILSVTNLTNTKNIFYINRVTNQTIYQLPILPSLGVSFKF